jgi:hypothetical protein
MELYKETPIWGNVRVGQLRLNELITTCFYLIAINMNI